MVKDECPNTQDRSYGFKLQPEKNKEKKPTVNIHWKDRCWSWSSTTLATWCRVSSLEKTLMLGKTESRSKRGPQRMRWLDGMTNRHESEQTLGDNEGREAWCAGVHGVTKSQTWLSDWKIRTRKNRRKKKNRDRTILKLICVYVSFSLGFYDQIPTDRVA